MLTKFHLFVALSEISEIVMKYHKSSLLSSLYSFGFVRSEVMHWHWITSVMISLHAISVSQQLAFSFRKLYSLKKLENVLCPLKASSLDKFQ